MKTVVVYTLIFISLMLPSHTRSSEDASLPYQREITKIIHSVEYSGFQILTRPDVTLEIDFNKRVWILRNIHHYDEKGNILLEQGRYGLCAELSTYLFQKIRGILSHSFDLKFAMVTEAGYFPTYQSNHIVLLLHEDGTPRTYLIDPSFHRYGKITDFQGYQLMALQDSSLFLKDKSPDGEFLVDQAMPLFVREDLLLSISVTSVDGKFDKDNFLLVISANKRNKISGLNVMIVGKHKGQYEFFESPDFLAQVMNPQEIRNLHVKIDSWMKKY